MADFLNFIRQRRAELRRNLEELDVAERVYRESLAEGESEPSLGELFGDIFNQATAWTERERYRPKTIKQMILQLLNENYPGGLTALEILDHIRKRWMPTLERTSLSPQITRLKGKNAVTNDKGKWFLVTEPAGAETVQGISQDDSGSPEKPNEAL